MSDSNFKIETSQRIQRLPPYLFGRINKMKYEKRVAGVDIIDLGMGNPTDPTPDSVVEKLAEAAKVLETTGAALQLRYLQTLVEIGVENSTTVVFPVPIDLLAGLQKKLG